MPSESVAVILVTTSSLRRRTVRPWQTRFDRLVAPTYSEPNGDVVGFVAFEHDAKPFEEWCGRQDLGHCFAAAVLIVGQ